MLPRTPCRWRKQAWPAKLGDAIDAGDVAVRIQSTNVANAFRQNTLSILRMILSAQ
jgi:hypothetical protein